MKIKFITCIFSHLYGSDLGGRPSRTEHYRLSLLSLLKMTDADFVCYTSIDEIDDLKHFFYNMNEISESKLELKTFNLRESKYSNLINEFKDAEEMKLSDRCYEIQYSKFDWFNYEDKSYDYYFWIDAGLSHTGIIPDKHLDGPGYRCYFESHLFNNDFLKNLISFTKDKFVVISKENVRNYWDKTVDPKFYNEYNRTLHIIGGLFGGQVSLWDNVVEKFDNYVNEVLNDEKKLYLEENIMTLMFYNHNDLFKNLLFDVWWHEDNYKEHPENFFVENKSFYKIIEELN
jgi:hypothetical protein